MVQSTLEDMSGGLEFLPSRGKLQFRPVICESSKCTGAQQQVSVPVETQLCPNRVAFRGQRVAFLQEAGVAHSCPVTHQPFHPWTLKPPPWLSLQCGHPQGHCKKVTVLYGCTTPRRMTAASPKAEGGAHAAGRWHSNRLKRWERSPTEGVSDPRLVSLNYGNLALPLSSPPEGDNTLSWRASTHDYEPRGAGHVSNCAPNTTTTNAVH